MNILVTGASGFIGSNLVDTFLADGHKVVGIDNFASGSESNLNPEIPFYDIAVGDDKLDTVLIDHKIDLVCHHAAQIDVRKSVSDVRYDARVNIVEGLGMLEKCVKNNVTKVVYASTGGAIYGEPPVEDLPASEATPPEPMCGYGVSKWAFELYLAYYKRLYDLDYTVLRYSNVYGPRQNPHGEAGVVGIFINNLLEGKPVKVFGDGKQTRDYVFVGDVCEANRCVLEAGSGTVYNIGTGVETSILEIIDALKLNFPDMEVLFEEARLGEVQRIALDVTKAREELGWTPKVQFTDGLQQTLDYLSSNSNNA